ncbi:flagellar hook capping FlgD N-terminal domain-containing protein [Devosia algicola]|uniref:Basal-body rod modification protein FlgD n=1 Tax=Devosia algicola TaxID=3026418 RepID=A0ABY7YS67_9HYPH|nr:flagellar hook capping FlgD N-terminal domain-containing protein [Devosia algicola]WDR04188.1 flagellar hook capping FlgD N-terminal domain-containing protein [Devosia algicola]
MAISGVSNTTSVNSSSSLAGSSAGLADNFDTFLNILTTQLKNQNPLDPMDTNAFTQQLVQFSGVEQQAQDQQVS